MLPTAALRDLRARNAIVREVVALLSRWRAAGPEGATVTAADLLRRPGTTLGSLRTELTNGQELLDHIDTLISPQPRHVARAMLAEVESTIVYGGYILKHDKHLVRQAHLDHAELPADFDYTAIKALSFEAREKLTRMRPATLGQAGRIDGVRAGDLAVLTIYLRRWRASHREREGRDDSELRRRPVPGPQGHPRRNPALEPADEPGIPARPRPSSTA